MKIFLTGHKGFIGSHLYKKLVELNHDVYTDMKYFDTFKWGCIIHLAATTTITTDFNPLIYENNIIFTKKILSTPYRTIYASSCSAKYNTNPYAASKIYNEWLGEKHGNAIGLRFHNVYGPNNNKGIIWFLMNQPDGAKITIRGAELIRDYISVEDVVKYICWCVENPIIKNKNKCKPGYSCAPFTKNIGIKDVGTGIGLQTMDVVNLYQRLSGKTFDISVIEAGDNEPKEMISSTPLPNALTLEEGLTKLLNIKQ